MKRLALLPGRLVGALMLMWVGTACWPGPRVGEPIDAGSGAYTFERLKAEVFTPTCAVSLCHAGAPPPLAPMSLEPEQAWASLLSVSTEAPALKRVEPGDPSRSYLMNKLLGTGGKVGGIDSRMPKGKPALNPELIAAISEWIERGAPND